MKFGNDNQKKKEIWHGIIHKARLDGDHSLDGMEEYPTPQMIWRPWMSVAAAAIVMLGILYMFLPSSLSNRYVDHKGLESIFKDSLSYSKLVLSTGDTISLDNSEEIQHSVAYLQGEGQVIDFRKLTSEEFGPKTQLIETGRGKQVHFILSDGTRVWLNAASKIEFPAVFGENVRSVQISGEVYFEVAHDAAKPFVVKTDDQQIKVLGTHFNVKQYGNDMERMVTLLEGAVEVSDLGGQSKFKLEPAQQFVQTANNRPQVRLLSNPETTIAWKEGTFYFEDADAQDIIKELERWYPVKIELKQYMKDKKISGRIKRSDSLRKVVEILEFFDIQILVEKD